MAKTSDIRNIRVLAFLEAYERQECLWDPSLDSYKNKGDRDQAYAEIIKELNVPSLTVHDVKLKVKGIRTTFAKELRILNCHKEQGKPYKPKLFWFNKANAFLKNVCVSRKKKEFSPKKEPSLNHSDCKDYTFEYVSEGCSGDELVENALNEDEHTSNSHDFKTFIQVGVEDQSDVHMEEEEQQNQCVEESFIDVQHDPTCAVISKPNQKTETSSYSDTTSTGPKEDEFDLFCRSVASQLRAIPDSYSRSMAKLKIQQILFEAETGHYKNSPCITIPIVQQINSL